MKGAIYRWFLLFVGSNFVWALFLYAVLPWPSPSGLLIHKVYWWVLLVAAFFCLDDGLFLIYFAANLFFVVFFCLCQWQSLGVFL